MSTQTGVAHFRVEPAFIAHTARALVTDGDWRGGDRILVCLCDEQGEPMRLDLRYGLLAGRLTLCGEDNEPEIVPWADCEERRAYLNLLAFQWAGLVRAGGNLWVPYAVVDRGYGIEDAAWSGHGGMRARYYADDCNVDRVVALPDRGTLDPRWRGATTLWKLAGDPPPWVEADTGAPEGDAFARAWLAWIAAGHAPDSRGAHYPEMDVPVNAVRPQIAGPSWSSAARERATDAEHEQQVAWLREQVQLRIVDRVVVRLSWELDGIATGVDVPKRLLAAYAVRGLRNVMEGTHAAAREFWIPSSPSGVKQPSDEAWHTDLLLAMGLPIDADEAMLYDHDAKPRDPVGAARRRALYTAVSFLQGLVRGPRGFLPLMEWANAPEATLEPEAPIIPIDPADPVFAFNYCAVLCGAGAAFGIVVHPGPDTEVAPGSIIVCANAGPEHYIAAVTAHRAGGGAVICENGGALSHLAVEGRASGFRVVVVPDARKLFPVGSRVRVDVGAGTVEIVEGPTP